MNKQSLNEPEKPLIVSRYFAHVALVAVLAGLLACSHNQQPGTGPQKRMRLLVGEIKEVSLPSPADTTVLLTGSSDNNEVVDVSQKPEAATQTNPIRSTSSGQLVFLIKGVTVGTARVVFSEKKAGETGHGKNTKAYLVQVVSK